MARTDPYDLPREDYYDTTPRNAGTGWIVALILIVAAIAAIMFFGRADTGGIATNPMTPGTSSTMNPPINQTPAAVPNPNPAAPKQ